MARQGSRPDKVAYILTERKLRKALAHRVTLQNYTDALGNLHVVEGRYKELHCSSCFGLLQIGDVIVSKRSTLFQRYYHMACAERANIWLDKGFCDSQRELILLEKALVELQALGLHLFYIVGSNAQLVLKFRLIQKQE